jgi:3'(2'), 5'-bisphosphate nucleotidase
MSPGTAPATPASPADHRDAVEIARAAGELLLRIRRALDHGADPDEVRAEGDRRSHELIVAALRERHPDDPVLSEEAIDDRRRLGSERVWIVDPLDGTREFGEPGRTDWAVHVALVVGGRPVAGAVALPARALVLGTAEPPALAPPSGGPPRVVVSRTRAPEWSRRLADALGGVLVELGSAGAKAMAVVLGEADVYAHAGGQREWDSAAPVAVAAAAGAHVSAVDGGPLVYNRPDVWLPDLLVCRPELAETTLSALATLIPAPPPSPNSGQ